MIELICSNFGLRQYVVSQEDTDLCDLDLFLTFCLANNLVPDSQFIYAKWIIYLDSDRFWLIFVPLKRKNGIYRQIPRLIAFICRNRGQCENTKIKKNVRKFNCSIGSTRI